MEPDLLEGFPLSVRSFLRSALEGPTHREMKDLISDTLRRVSSCGCSSGVMTPPQLHQLSSQIIILQCLMRRQAAAEFLQTEPELVAELAAEAASHGPLVLLQLPLSEYRPVDEEATRRKRKRRLRQPAVPQGAIWSSNDSEDNPVAIAVVPESHVAPPEEFVPMIPLKPLLINQQRRHQGRAVQRSRQQAPDAEPATETPTGRLTMRQKPKYAVPLPACGESDSDRELSDAGEPVSTPPRRKPGRPRKGTEPLIPKQLRKLDFKLPVKQPPRKQGRPRKHPKPSSAGTTEQRSLQECPASAVAPSLRPQAVRENSGKLGRSQARQGNPEEREKATSKSVVSDVQGQEAREQGVAGRLLGGKQKGQGQHGTQQQHSAPNPRPKKAVQLRMSRLELDDEDNRLGNVAILLSAQQVRDMEASAQRPTPSKDRCRQRPLEAEESEISSNDSSCEEEDIIAELPESDEESDVQSSDADQAEEEDAPKLEPQAAHRAEGRRALHPRSAEPARLFALRPVRLPPVPEEENFCSVCGDEDGDDSENKVLLCEGKGCQVAVHQQCYGISKLPDNSWLCDGCTAGVSSAASACVLCPCSGGALRRVRSLKEVQAPAARNFGGGVHEGLQEGESASSNGTSLHVQRRIRSGGEPPIEGEEGTPLWAHSACALWTPDVKFAEPEKLDGVRLDDLTQGRIDTLCAFCGQGGGAAICCNFARCRTAFHPLCGRSNGCILPLADSGKTLAFCGLHSHDQYATARERLVADE